MCFKSLYDEYVAREANSWRSYYNITIVPSKLFSDTSSGSEHCKDFIKKHFEKGKKAGVFDIDFLKNYKINGKHEHTVALYLLGLLLQDVFYPQIKIDLCRLGINNVGWYEKKDFMYTWYLTCLYHDVASCVENIRDPMKPCGNNCIFKLKNPYSYSPKVATGKIVRVSEQLVKNYFRYRIDNGKVDHGIYGGILLFDRLLKNFEKKTIDYSWEDKSEYICDHVSWRLEYIDHFAYVSDAIICHNMWTVQANNDEDVKKYQKYRLGELIIDLENSDDQRLFFDKYPLHFMLCLLDTIEPVKRFTALTAREVLDNISIELEARNNEKNQIRIAWKEKIKNQVEFWTWMKNISSMSDWMKVDVSSCVKVEEWCYITISF